MQNSKGDLVIGYAVGRSLYAESFCWAQDTYFIPFKQAEISVDEEVRHRQKIGYYQWVPFFLVLQSVSFYLPSMLRKLVAGHSGMRVEEIVNIATDSSNIKPDIRKNTIRILTVHLENALRFHRRSQRRNIVPHKYLRCLNFPYSAFYVTFVYLMTKLGFLANVTGQFFLMNRFLIGKHDYNLYGYGALTDMANGSTWHTSGVFPRVTLCDFHVRSVGSNVQQFTIQCVLLINLFNEKIFVFLWFWFVVLFGVTLVSTAYWCLILTIPHFSRSYIRKNLELSEMPFDFHEGDNERLVRRFVGTYLKTDGIFVIRMVTMHTSIIFCTDLIVSLWRSFYGLEANKNQNPATTKEFLETAARKEYEEALKREENGHVNGPGINFIPSAPFNDLFVAPFKGGGAQEQKIDRLESLEIDKLNSVANNLKNSINGSLYLQKSESLELELPRIEDFYPGNDSNGLLDNVDDKDDAGDDDDDDDDDDDGTGGKIWSSSKHYRPVSITSPVHIEEGQERSPKNLSQKYNKRRTQF